MRGLTVNDDYFRATNRINVESRVKPWLTIGTRTQFSYEDESGAGPSWSSAYSMNPLTHAYDEDGNIKVYPWDGNYYFANPLQGLLYKDKDEAFSFTKRVAREEGLLTGISTGAVLAAVSKLSDKFVPGSRILAFNYDTGERYLSAEGLF